MVAILHNLDYFNKYKYKFWFLFILRLGTGLIVYLQKKNMSGSELDISKQEILEICHQLPLTEDLIKFLKEKEIKIPAVVNIFAIPSSLSKLEEEDKEDLELLSL